MNQLYIVFGMKKFWRNKNVIKDLTSSITNKFCLTTNWHDGKVVALKQLSGSISLGNTKDKPADYNKIFMLLHW